LSLGLLLSYLAIASNGFVIGSHRAVETGTPKPEAVCEFEPQPALYGLGIRVGIYLQWGTACIVLLIWKWHKSPDTRDEKSEAEISFAIATCLIFLFSVFIAVCVSTAHHSLQLAEFAILLYICLGSLCLLLLLAFALILAELHFGAIRHVIHTGLAVAISIFNVIFWFKLADSFDQKDCRTYLFLFAKLDMLGPARKWFKVQSVLVLLYTLCMIVLGTYYFFRKYREMGDRKVLIYLLNPRDKAATQPNPSSSPPPSTLKELAAQENPMEDVAATHDYRSTASGEIYVIIGRHAVRQLADAVIVCAKEMSKAPEEVVTGGHPSPQSALIDLWNQILNSRGEFYTATQNVETAARNLKNAAIAAVNAMRTAANGRKEEPSEDKGDKGLHKRDNDRNEMENALNILSEANRKLGRAYYWVTFMKNYGRIM